MIENIIISVSQTSKETLIDNLQSSIFNWQIDKNEDNFKNIVAQTHMLQIKAIVGNDVQKALRLMEDVDRIKRSGLDEE